MIDPISASVAGNHDALEFYRALHNAMDDTVRKHAQRPLLIDALLSQAFDSFRGNITIQCEDEPPLACFRGCASCCTLRVAATAPEVFLVARYVRSIMPALLDRDIDLVARIRERARAPGRPPRSQHGFEALEVRRPQIQALGLAGIRMRGAERLGPRPGLEGGDAFPGGVRHEDRGLAIGRALQQSETLEARHRAELAVALAPDFDELRLAASGNAETIHGDEHQRYPSSANTCRTTGRARTRW
jgi:hypothetical protein